MPEAERHFYELIKQSMSIKRLLAFSFAVDAPCHLYFDLEYSKELNPNASPDMIQIFKHCVLTELWKVFGIEICQKSIVDLDSSTDTKFSRHLIVRIPHCAFASNAEAGTSITYS